jgi:hypothetical protein
MLFFQLPHLPEWLLSRNDYGHFYVRSLLTPEALRQNVTDADFAIYKSGTAVSRAHSPPRSITTGRHCGKIR